MITVVVLFNVNTYLSPAMARQRVADRLQLIATGCFWPITACRQGPQSTRSCLSKRQYSIKS